MVAVSPSSSKLSPSQSADPVRSRSKALFGNQDRAEVIRAIALNGDRAVNATDLAAETGLINNRVRAQLLALVEAELLEEVPITGGERKRWYLRRDSSFWQACLDLYDKWTGSDGISSQR